MKRVVFILIAMLLIPLTEVAAQNQNMDKLNSYKIAFFTKRLNLNPREAEKFWPVYNEYQDQKTQIQVDKSIIIRNFNQNENTLTDKQITELGDKLIESIEQELSLTVSFHKKLKEVLPPAKVIRFHQVENQYKAQLLNELQNRQQQRLAPGRGL